MTASTTATVAQSDIRKAEIAAVERPSRGRKAPPPTPGQSGGEPGGFTLVELLVVITIIIVLLALLMPALGKAVSAAELAKCGSQQHALVQIFTTYASSRSDRRYPAGNRDCGGEFAFQMSTPFVQLIVEYAGNNKSTRATTTDAMLNNYEWGRVPAILVDPSFKDFGYLNVCGWLTGYTYLGGKPYTSLANRPPNHSVSWDSPMSLARPGSGQLVSCLTAWYTGSNTTWVAHTEAGALGGDAPSGGYWHHPPSGDPDARRNGALGGNVGLSDGSVAWRAVADMEAYHAACYPGGTIDPGYYAMW